MRRADLVVGAELFYCSSTKWMTSLKYGKAVVVATEPFRQPISDWRKPSPPVKTTKGPGVLVDLFSIDRQQRRQPDTLVDKPTRRVVSLVALRGPWEETLASVRRQQQITDAVVDTRQKVRADLAALAQALTDRAAQLGIRVDSREEYRHGDVLPPTRLIEIRMDEFERVLERLEENQ